MTYLDDATLQAIEADLDEAHTAYGHGNLSMRNPMKAAVRAGEVVGAAALMSYANAKSATGEVKIGPVPLDLGLGVGLGLAALFDLAGGYEDDAMNFGIGCLAAWGARTGAAFGAASHALTHKASGIGGVPELTGMTTPEITGMKGPRSFQPGTRHYHTGAAPAGTQRFVVQQLG